MRFVRMGRFFFFFLGGGGMQRSLKSIPILWDSGRWKLEKEPLGDKPNPTWALAALSDASSRFLDGKIAHCPLTLSGGFWFGAMSF